MASTTISATPPAPPVSGPPTVNGAPPPPPIAIGTAPNRTTTILKNVAVFGIAGAAAGFGASLIGLPVIGGIAAPILAAVGGALGALVGAIKGVSDANRDEKNYSAQFGGMPAASGWVGAPPLPPGLPPR